MLEGRPAHGRATRIARRLRMNRRTVDRILAALLSVAK
jgi:DNA-binding IclR family transcriptional regulator